MIQMDRIVLQLGKCTVFRQLSPAANVMVRLVHTIITQTHSASLLNCSAARSFMAFHGKLFD